MKTQKKLFAVMLAALLAAGLINGCKKEDNPAAPPPNNVEHPPATTVTFVLLDSAGTTVLDTCTVRDTTLVHNKPPLVGQLDLIAGNTYSGTMRLYDETTNPVTVVTGDIISEQDAHLFVYTPTDTNRVRITNRDLDSHGLLFGLNFKITVTAGSGATGNIHVILQHHDDGVKFNGDGTFHDPYDLDMDADYPYSIAP